VLTSCEAPYPETGHCVCTLELGHAGDHQHGGSGAQWPREQGKPYEHSLTADPELATLRTCVAALDGLEQEAIERVISYLSRRFIQDAVRR